MKKWPAKLTAKLQTKLPAISIAIVIFLAGSARAQYPTETTKFFSIRGDKGYPYCQEQLQNLVQRKGKAPVNHISVIGYKYADGNRNAWVYWPEGNSIILWDATRYEYPDQLSMSDRYLDLKKDVVPTEKDIHGSTYLVSADWVQRIRKDCAAHGDHFVIYKKAHWKPPVAHLE
jgi:hypothetical protein